MLQNCLRTRLALCLSSRHSLQFRDDPIDSPQPTQSSHNSGMPPVLPQLHRHTRPYVQDYLNNALLQMEPKMRIELTTYALRKAMETSAPIGQVLLEATGVAISLTPLVGDT